MDQSWAIRPAKLRTNHGLETSLESGGVRARTREGRSSQLSPCRTAARIGRNRFRRLAPEGPGTLLSRSDDLAQPPSGVSDAGLPTPGKDEDSEGCRQI